MLVVHIGLGKTATSSLHRSVFPEIARIKGIRYNEPYIDHVIRRCIRFSLDHVSRSSIKAYFTQSKGALISFESRFKTVLMIPLGDIKKLQFLSDLLPDPKIESGDTIKRFHALSWTQKIASLPKKVSSRLSNYFQWRWLMQNIINKLVPYKKYKLPTDLYLNEEMIAKNRAFLSKISREPL